MMRSLEIAKVLAYGVGAFCAVAWSADASRMFDKPLREQHLPLPSDPLNPQVKATLSCFYYPSLMVKQVDMGEKGAEQLSMISIQKGQKTPACRRENVDGESVVGDWSGYFLGVRQGYVFFSGDDSTAGGEPFAVYDGAGSAKIFHDVAAPLQSVEPMLPPRDPELRPWYHRPLVLKYRKVYVAPCSMRSDGAHCWGLIKQATGVVQTSAPDCDSAYAVAEKNAPQDQLDGLRRDPSVIVYSVEAVIDDQGATRVTPTSSVHQCYPAP